MNTWIWITTAIGKAIAWLKRLGTPVMPTSSSAVNSPKITADNQSTVTQTNFINGDVIQNLGATDEQLKKLVEEAVT